MDYQEFKFLRAEVNKMTKRRLKGEMFHKSYWIEPVEGTKTFIKKTKTYIKPKENAS